MDIASLFTTPTAPTGATAGMGTPAGNATSMTGGDEVQNFNRLLKGFLDNSGTTGSAVPALRTSLENAGTPRQGDAVNMASQPPQGLEGGTPLVTEGAPLPPPTVDTTPEMRWQQAGLNLLAMGQADDTAPPLSDEVASFLNDLSALMRQQGLFAGKTAPKINKGEDNPATLSTGQEIPAPQTMAASAAAPLPSIRTNATPTIFSGALATNMQVVASPETGTMTEEITITSTGPFAGPLAGETTAAEDDETLAAVPIDAEQAVKAAAADSGQDVALLLNNGLMPPPVADTVATPMALAGKAHGDTVDALVTESSAPSPNPTPAPAKTGREVPASRRTDPVAAGMAASTQATPGAGGQQHAVTRPDIAVPEDTTTPPATTKAGTNGPVPPQGTPVAAVSSVPAAAIAQEPASPAVHSDRGMGTAAAEPPVVTTVSQDNAATRPDQPIAATTIIRSPGAPTATETRPAARPDQGTANSVAVPVHLANPAPDSDRSWIKPASVNTGADQVAARGTVAAGSIILPAGMQPSSVNEPTPTAEGMATSRTAQSGPAVNVTTNPVVAPPPSAVGTTTTGSIVLPAGMQPATVNEPIPTAEGVTTKAAPSGPAVRVPAPSNVAVDNSSVPLRDAAPPTSGDAPVIAPITKGASAATLTPAVAPTAASRSNALADSATPVANGTPAAAATDRGLQRGNVTTATAAQPVSLDQGQPAASTPASKPGMTRAAEMTENPKPAVKQADLHQNSTTGITDAPRQQSAITDQQPAIPAAPAGAGETEMADLTGIGASALSGTSVKVTQPQQPQPAAAIAQPETIAPASNLVAGDTTPQAPADNAETAREATASPTSTGISQPAGTVARQKTANPTATSGANDEVAAPATDKATVRDDNLGTGAIAPKEGGKPRRMLAPHHTETEAATHMAAMEAAGERPQQAAPRPASTIPTTTGATDSLLSRAVAETGSTAGGELGTEQQGAQTRSGTRGLEETSLNNAAADGGKVGAADFSQHLRQTSAPGAPHRPGTTPPATYQVAVQMQRAAQDGNDKISIQLRPYDLGRVDVQLEFNKEGRLRAKVTADSFQTLELLQKDSRNLENALREAGLSTDQNSLSFSLRDDGDQAQRQQQEKQQDQKSGTRFASIEVEEDGPAIPAYQPIMGPGRVDVRI
ncbi:hypothetical protein GE253_13325 [Niveispirillum sp. SYP-B3756]|uniref:flagellar hook-length control protein FliK n=1 Tax=Niveispirillum sp. SYP-B3756 TaxID=2662178 RepID=UPI0012923C85|nr:flagellar hook-length control protein FliK [Niveispirillum sp. SYP-B3756]MQP66319.1 hypothetical protein [Niveispirillum sp. SYP-B3756]